jgi:PGF-CTERM protein/PGF-pre-PGF domain-containing protein
MNRPVFRSHIAVFLTLLVVLSLPISGITAATSTGLASNATQETNYTTTLDVEATSTQDPGPVAVSEALQSNGGTVEAIVTFESQSTEAVGTASQASVVEQLKQQADVSQETFVAAADRSEALTVKNQFWLTNAVLVEVDTSKVPLSDLAAIQGVRSIEENAQVRSLSTKPATNNTGALSGPSIGTTSTPAATYGLDQIGAPEVWEKYNRGEGVRVAVLDSGIDTSHPDLTLAENGWAEFNSTTGNQVGSDPRYCGSHGTHVSGTVGGGNASGQHIGVAPNVELMHGGVLMSGSNCIGSMAGIISGMEWAVNNDADVISMSLALVGEDENGDPDRTVSSYTNQFVTPIKNAENASTIVVAASGNIGDGKSQSPGNLYSSFSVGASDQFEDIPSLSNGENVSKDDFSEAPNEWPESWTVPDVVAPGLNINSTMPDGSYEKKSGTSMAAPHVSGTAALMLSANKDLTPSEIKTVLEETAWKPTGNESKDTRYGYGIINASAAVDMVSDNTINGTITDAQTGTPIENATVTVTEIDDDGVTEEDSVTTSRNGNYVTTVGTNSDVKLGVFAENYTKNTISTRVEFEDVTDVDAQLSGSTSISGTVTETRTNKSVTGTNIVIGNESLNYTVSTDASGSYSTPVSPVIEQPLTVTVDGYESLTLPSLDEREDNNVDLTVDGNARLNGTVTLQSNPVENANVTLEAEGINYSAVETGADGQYVFEQLPGNRTYDVSVDKTGYEYAGTVVLGSGESKNQTLNLSGNAVLNGTVVDAVSGDQVPDTTITATASGEQTVSTETTANGSYELSGLAGTNKSAYDIEINGSGYHTNSTQTLLFTDNDRQSLNVALVGNASFSGTVTSRDTGQTLSDATVLMKTNTGTLSYTTQTDANGAYKLPNIRGNTEYSITFDHEYHSSETPSREINNGKQKPLNVTLNKVNEYFSVESVDAPKTVTQGKTLVLNASIQNRGRNFADYDVTLSINNNTVDTTYTFGQPRTVKNVILEHDIDRSQTPGNYTYTVEANDSVTVDVTVKKQPRISGSTGGGSQLPQQEDTTQGMDDHFLELTESSPVTVTVSDERLYDPGTTVSVGEETVTRMTFNADEGDIPGEITVEESQSTAVDPLREEVTVHRAVNITVPPFARETSTTMELAVRAADVDNPENLAVTRYNDETETWEPLETAVVSERIWSADRRASVFLLEAETPGFSTFAVIESESGNPTLSEINTTANEEQINATETTDESDDSIPGFGPVVAVVALLVGALGMSRRQ